MTQTEGTVGSDDCVGNRSLELEEQKVFPERWRSCRPGLIRKHPLGLPNKKGPALQLLRWGSPEATFRFNNLQHLICISLVKLHFADEKAHLTREMTQPKRSQGEAQSSAVDVSLPVSSSLCCGKIAPLNRQGKHQLLA